MTNDLTHNLIIVGSGPAAWTAAIYAGRALLSPIVLAGEQGGGQLMFTTEVENYPGFEHGILGPDLMAAMRKQAERFGAKIIEKDAISLSVIGSQFSVVCSGSVGFQSVGQKPENRKLTNLEPTRLQSPSAIADGGQETENGKQITGHAVILATGATANTLKLPGEDRLMGRGVGTCAVCDAPFYKGKDTVFVIGGGDSAVEEATALAKFAEKVILVVRSDSLRASEIMKNRIKSYANIQIWYKSQVKEFIGEKKLEKVRIERTGTVEDVAADGVFYAIGHTPSTGWLQGSGVEIDEKGYIKTHIDYGFGSLLTTNNEQRITVFPTSTSVPGIFAAGDCVDPRYRQAITASGFGAMAALDAEKWLEKSS